MTDGGTWQPPRPDDEAPSPALVEPPTITAPVESARPRRGRGTVIAGVVGAVAIVGAGVFAISRVTGSDSAGGAKTPEDAGLALLTALENEDVLGIVDLLLPGERDTLRGPMVQMVSELQRIEVLSGDADLSAVAGVDIEFTDESVDVEETNVDDIAFLMMRGSGTGSIDGEALPIGDLLLDLTGVSPPELSVPAPDAEAFSLPMAAVEEGGRWYLSGGFTIAELYRRGTLPELVDIPTEGIAAVGGDSPEDAMDNLLDGIEALDLEGIIGALNPNEFQALQRYAPLFVADGQAALDEAKGVFTIDDPEYVVSGTGDSRSLTFSYLRVGLDIDGDHGRLTLQDGCWTIEAPDFVFNTCEEAVPPTQDGIPPDLFEDLRRSFQDTLAGFEDSGFSVQRVDGKWFISPIATVFDQLLAVARALDRTDIEELQGSLQELIEQFETGLVPRQTEIIEDYTLPEDGGWSSFPDDSAVDPAENCWGESDVMSAAACFQALVDDGTIDQFVVPFYLLAPECGLAEVGWNGEYYTLPDDDFVAIVEETAPCFQEQVATGELDELSVPPEVLRPECLEGRNPYNTTDETYLEAYDACAFG